MTLPTNAPDYLSEPKLDLAHDMKRFRNTLRSRYKSLYQLKNGEDKAKAVKRAYLDLNKILKKHGI